LKGKLQSWKSWPLPLVVAAVGFLVVLQLRDSTPVMPPAPEAMASGAGLIRAPHREAPASAVVRQKFAPHATADELQNLSLNKAKTSKRSPGIDAVISRQTVVTNGNLSGFRVFPSNDDHAELFSRLGLRPGDMVIAIDGVALDDLKRAEELWREVSAKESANLTVERDGQVLEVPFYFDDTLLESPQA
jgi:type II secretion system protein C